MIPDLTLTEVEPTPCRKSIHLSKSHEIFASLQTSANHKISTKISMPKHITELKDTGKGTILTKEKWLTVYGTMLGGQLSTNQKQKIIDCG